MAKKSVRGNYVSCRSFFFSFEFPVSWCPRDYEFHGSCVEKITRHDTTGRICPRPEFSRKEKISVPTVFSHYKITNSNQSENALLLIVVLKESFQFIPILLYSTGLTNNSNYTLPPRTGLLGRPLIRTNTFVRNSFIRVQHHSYV